MLPQSNARLISIQTDGVSEDWDRPAGPAGPAKWQGNEDAYVIEKVRTAYTGDGPMAKTRDVQIIISASLRGVDGNPLIIATGDIFTYQFRGITHTRRVMEFNGAFMPILPAHNFVRVHLNPEALETALEGE